MTKLKENFEPHKVVTSYFNDQGFVQNQLNSYNYFILKGIQQVIDESDSIKIVSNSNRNDGETLYDIKFGKIYLSLINTYKKYDTISSASI